MAVDLQASFNGNHNNEHVSQRTMLQQLMVYDISTYDVNPPAQQSVPFSRQLSS